MIKLYKQSFFIVLFIASLTLAQNHKIGGKLSVGIEPLVFSSGLNYYFVSNEFALRASFNASAIMSINMSSKSIQLYRNDNLYMLDFSIQGLTNPFRKNKDCYFGAGIGYYIINGDGASGNSASTESGYIRNEEFANTIGFSLIMGVSPSSFFLIEFDYLILFTNQILTIDDYNSSEELIFKESLNLSQGRINFIFAFGL